MVVSHNIVVRGEVVGTLLTLGRRFVLYTAHPKLQDLDEMPFDTADAARKLVRERLGAEQPDAARPAAA